MFTGYTLNSKQPEVPGGFLPALALPVFVFVCEAPFLLLGESRSHPACQALAPLCSAPLKLDRSRFSIRRVGANTFAAGALAALETRC